MGMISNSQLVKAVKLRWMPQFLQVNGELNFSGLVSASPKQRSGDVTYTNQRVKLRQKVSM